MTGYEKSPDYGSPLNRRDLKAVIWIAWVVLVTAGYALWKWWMG